MKYQLLIFHLILVVFLTSCASGQNPYFNNKNTLGLLGGAGGALLGLLAGTRAEEYFDNLDRQRNIDLIVSCRD